MTDASTDRPFRRRVLVNTAAVGASNVWSMVLALVSLPLMLRGLGSAAFGTWVLLQTFSAVNGWGSLLDLGMATAGTREVAGRHGVDDDAGLADAVGTTLLVLTVLGIASGLVFSVVGPFVLPAVFQTPDRFLDAVRFAIVVYGCQIALDLVTGAFQSVLDGYQRVDRARAVDVTRRTLVTVATTVAALVTHELGAVAVASAVATAVGTVVGGVVTRSTARGIRPTASMDRARALFHYGKTVAVLRPLGVLHRTVDRFVVGVILGPSAVSLVEIATQIQNGADSVLAASSYAVVPTSARLQAQEEPGKLVELVETGTRFSLLATWPVAALSAVLAAPLIDVWVGARYAESATLIVLASIALCILAPAQVGSNHLLGTGRARTILRVALLAIVVNVIGSIVLVHQVGVSGAFLATILGALITAPLLLVAVLEDLHVGAAGLVGGALVPAAGAPLAAVVAAGAVVLLPLGSWPTLILGGAAGTLAAAAAALRWGLRPHERQAVLRIVRRRTGSGAGPSAPSAA